MQVLMLLMQALIQRRWASSAFLPTFKQHRSPASERCTAELRSTRLRDQNRCPLSNREDTRPAKPYSHWMKLATPSHQWHSKLQRHAPTRTRTFSPSLSACRAVGSRTRGAARHRDLPFWLKTQLLNRRQVNWKQRVWHFARNRRMVKTLRSNDAITFWMQ